MSIFASDVTKVLDQIPGATEGATITIRKLPGRHYWACAKESQRKAMSDLKEMGTAFAKEVQEFVKDGKKVEDAKKTDPLILFDAQMLVERGITAWSFPKPVSPEAIADLDADSIEHIAREILRLTKPRLFQTEDEATADEKNG